MALYDKLELCLFMSIQYCDNTSEPCFVLASLFAVPRYYFISFIRTIVCNCITFMQVVLKIAIKNLRKYTQAHGSLQYIFFNA